MHILFHNTIYFLLSIQIMDYIWTNKGTINCEPGQPFKITQENMIKSVSECITTSAVTDILMKNYSKFRIKK